LDSVFDESEVTARGESGLQELGTGDGGFGPIDEAKLLMLARLFRELELMRSAEDVTPLTVVYKRASLVPFL
jgi:hypothetical protein